MEFHSTDAYASSDITKEKCSISTLPKEGKEKVIVRTRPNISTA
jgi:hypothetical protein